MGRPTSRVSRVEVEGPLAPFAKDFRARLADLGYTPLTRVNAMRLTAHVSSWLEANDLAAGDLSDERVVQYFEERRAGGLSASWTPASVAPLLEMLRQVGVLEVEPPGPAEKGVLASFRSYLLSERALAPTTALREAGSALPGRLPRQGPGRPHHRRRGPSRAPGVSGGIGGLCAVLRGRAALLPALLLRRGPGGGRPVGRGARRDRPTPGIAASADRP